jgi:hypothetical protein
VFKRVGREKSGNTSRTSEVMISPKILVQVFGEPDSGDDYKVSGEYVFESEDGKIFTLYDWKSTSLYDSYGPDPDEFWSSDIEFQLNIGSNEGWNGDASDFINFIKGAKLETVIKAIIE